MSKSIVKLSDEQQYFWEMLLIRVTNQDPEIGQPWLSRGFFKMTPVYAPGLSTMAIDERWIVYIDFDFMMKKGLIYAAGVLHHEVWHPLRNYYERAQKLQRVPEGADAALLNNIASDLEINDDIRHLVPEDALLPGKGSFIGFPEKHTHEQYFQQLISNLETAEQFSKVEADQPPPAEDKTEEQKGTEEDETFSSDTTLPDTPPREEDNEDNTSDSSSKQNSESEEESESDIASNQKRENQDSADNSDEEEQNSLSDSNSDKGDDSKKNESNSSSKGSEGASEQHTSFGERANLACSAALEGQNGLLDDFLLPDNEAEEAEVGLSDEDAAELLQHIAQDVTEYPYVGSGASQGLMVWADDVLAHTPVDWRQTLRAMVKNAIAYKRGKLDYSWQKLARRQPSPDLMRPGLRMPKVKIGIAIDKSGSNLNKLGVVLDEVDKIMKSVGVRGQEVLAFAVDVQADEQKPVHDVKKLFNDVKVGGGTRMTPGYVRLGELDVDLALLFTDAEVYDWPQKRPETKNRSMKYYTVCIVADSKSGNNLLEKAHASLDSWSKIIEIRIT